MSIRLPSTPTSARRGFSFTEILFAVMILGIGFIMVAAIFPVALRQTETSQGETVGAAVARAGVNFISQSSTATFVSQANVTAATPLINFGMLRPTIANSTFPDDYTLLKGCLTGIPMVPAPPSTSFPELIGDVWSFDWDNFELAAAVNATGSVTNPLTTLSTPQPLSSIFWPMMAQNMIQASDPRYAWVAFYRRNLVETSVSPVIYSYAPSAQIIVIALQSRAKQFYDQSDLLLNTADQPVSIQPSRGSANIMAPGLSSLSYTIQFNGGSIQNRAAEGAFVIIASDNLPPGTLSAGTLNGHIYRLGTQIDSQTWEFAPGFGPIGTSEAAFIGSNRNFTVYMVGKAQDPNNASQYAGSAQDIAAYSTFISCPAN